jgi:hypothetical protein
MVRPPGCRPIEVQNPTLFGAEPAGYNWSPYVLRRYFDTRLMKEKTLFFDKINLAKVSI